MSKTFDTDCRSSLWAIMKTFESPERSILIIPQIHDGMEIRIIYKGVISEVIPILKRMKQGCSCLWSLSLTWEMFFSAATVDNEVKIRITKVYGMLRHTVWNRNGSSVATKIKVYRAAIIFVLFYAIETGTFTPYIKHN